MEPPDRRHTAILRSLIDKFRCGKQRYVSLDSGRKQYAILYVTDGGGYQPEYIGIDGTVVEPDNILSAHQQLYPEVVQSFCHYPHEPYFNYSIARPRRRPRPEQLGPVTRPRYVHTEEILLKEIFPQIEQKVFRNKKKPKFIYLYTYFLPCEPCFTQVIQPFISWLQILYGFFAPKLIIGYSRFQPGEVKQQCWTRFHNIKKFLYYTNIGAIYHLHHPSITSTPE